MVILLIACTGPKDVVGPDSEEDSALDTQPIVDADGDGYAEGDDCDDTNPNIHPGAAERCDGVDQNCDGQNFAPGVCSEVQTMADSAVWMPQHDGSVPSMHLASDGDHLITWDDSPDRLSYYDDPYGEPVATFAMNGQWAGVWRQHRWVDGDWDGDGEADLIFVTGVLPGAFIFSGPVAPNAGEYLEADADYQIRYLNWNYTWNSVSIGGDLNGDGQPDIAAQTLPFYTTDGAEDDILIVPSGADGVEDCVRMVGEASGDPSITADVTGDGLSELQVRSTTMYLLDDALQRDGGTFDTDPLAEVGDDIWEVGVWLDAGDWDGDGINDIAVRLRPGIDGGGDEAICILSKPAGLLDPDSFPCLVSTGLYFSTIRPWLGDTENLMINAASDAYGADGHIIINRADGMPVGRESFESRRHVVFTGESFYDPAGDLNGDGLRDMLIGNADQKVGYLPGFVVPWDEDEWWD